MPRVIIGSPLFNHAKDFREAIESILGQTCSDFALVLVDDCSTDETAAIAREYAAADPRVTYVANETRLGLVDNACRAFEIARQMYPDAEYFAWASDHDLWHPRWLQALVDTLDQDPNLVLTWQYYGLWQLERGNREQALYHLGRIASICGTDCEEYRSLAAALDKPTGTALAY